MRFDDILKVIGEFGPYQRWIFILICLPIIFIGICDMNNTLLLFSPKHRCNESYNTTRWYSQRTANLSGRFTQITDEDVCFTNLVNSSDENATSLKQPCKIWTYDQSVFIETFVSQVDPGILKEGYEVQQFPRVVIYALSQRSPRSPFFWFFQHNLVCEDADIPAYIQIFMYSGALTGSLFQGFLADRFGRQRMICYSLVVVFVSGLASAWSPNYYIFAILRFIQIMTSRGVYISSFILAIEMVGPSKRQWAGFLFNYPYSAGIALLAGIGYGLRHWKYIQIACTAPIILFVMYWWVIPESPRWLISKGMVDEARKTVLKIAASSNTINCVPLYADMYEKADKNVKKKHGIIDYLKRRSLLCQSLVIFFNSFVIFHCFYGFTLNTENLAGNFYLNVLLCGLADLPGYTIALLSAGRMGRKKVYIFGMVVAGLSLLGSGAVSVLTTEDFKIAPIVLAMIGKIGMAVGFSVVYMWSAELFPTVVRNTGIGLSTCFGNLGYMAAPAVARLGTMVPGRVGRAVPIFVFGFLCLIAALMTLTLPETQNVYLPETVAHSKAMNRESRYKLRKKEPLDEHINLSGFNS